ncbi:HlyD family efflux transporter periplasmic adaptor subunit [Scytonema sp. UIC 10036]|uniref:HlyD family secretion protein n=1 Tax=Scytonema sp. UIC 10036 TaxID=2304196 RepID=UPI0012DA8EC9|nr:HlyD family efflux transporter periplasmic adaptor subunit [Scytonema sp. UIC 10036]MUG96858.1 HlyD family efflux transporter periplasmic adaptor subunit [Scytonema sp. UIC 10036]
MDSVNFPSKQQVSSSYLKQDLNPSSLHPSTPEEFLPSIGRWVTLGGLVFLIGFGAAIALVSVLKYKVTVKAPATIRPVGELRLVQAATEGTIKSLNVAENQTVQKGDVIAYIDNFRFQTKKSQLQGNIHQARQQLTQVDAQIQAINEQMTAEVEQTKRTLASAQAQLTLKQRNYEDKLITTAAEVEETEAALELARDELSRYYQLANTGAIAQLQLKEKESALKAAIARHKRVRSTLNPSNAEVVMAQEEIARETARAKATQATLKQQREQLIQRRVEIQNQLNSDRNELQQIETELKNTIIRASTSGIIQKLNLRNPEQVVRPGDVIAQIVKSQAPLEIKALVSSQDINKVKIDQPVQMRVSACSYTDYGTLKGTVSAISPDSITYESKDADNLPMKSGGEIASATYEVTINPETLTLSAGKNKCAIQSGMQGQAEILAQEETVLTFILRKAKLLIDL